MQYKETYKKPIAPLVSTVWGTGYPYNMYTPIPTGRTKHNPPGCNAVVLAQLVKYWGDKYFSGNETFNVRQGDWSVEGREPSQSDINSGSSNLGYVAQSNKAINVKNLETYYNWYKYPSAGVTYDKTNKVYKLSSASLYPQVDSIADFMLDCALSINSIFSTSGSTSNGSNNTYGTGAKTFKLQSYKDVYSTHLCYYNKTYEFEGDTNKSDTSNITALEQAIYNCLSVGVPVAFAAFVHSNNSGHTFIIDGYDNGFFHVNWGWAGKCDGWMKLNTLSTSGRGHLGYVGYLASYEKDYIAYAVKHSKASAVPKLQTGDNQYYNIQSSDLNIAEDIRVVSIDTSLCDGIANREQHLYIELENVSGNYYTETSGTQRRVDVYFGDSKKDYLRLLMSPGGKRRYHVAVSLSAGTYNIQVRSGSSVLQGDNNKSFIVTKRDVINKISLKNAGYIVSSGANFLGSNRFGANAVNIRLGNPDLKQTNTVNSNNFDVTVDITCWLMYLNSSHTASSYTVSRSGFGVINGVYRHMFYKFKANATNKDVNIPISVQNLPMNKRVLLQFSNSDDLTSNVVAGVFDITPSINFYTKEGRMNHVYPSGNSSDKADYSNTNVVLDDREDILAIDFSDVNFKGITSIGPNRNVLYYFNSTQTPPSILTGRNVIKGNVAAGTINFYDGEAVVFPKTFTASKVVFHLTPDTGITLGTNKGWRTVSFPFDVDKVMCDGKEIDWFHSGEDTGKQFWLMGFDGVEYDSLAKGSEYRPLWRYVDKIRKNETYIIAFPGDMYGDASLIGKEITFEGSNATFNASLGFGLGDDYDKTIGNITFPSQNVRFYPEHVGEHEVWNSSNWAQTTNVVDLKGTTTERLEEHIYRLSDDGSQFIYSSNGQLVKPFEGYFKDAYRRYLENQDLTSPPSPNRAKQNTTVIYPVEVGSLEETDVVLEEDTSDWYSIRDIEE